MDKFDLVIRDDLGYMSHEASVPKVLFMPIARSAAGAVHCPRWTIRRSGGDSRVNTLYEFEKDSA